MEIPEIAQQLLDLSKSLDVINQIKDVYLIGSVTGPTMEARVPQEVWDAMQGEISVEETRMQIPDLKYRLYKKVGAKLMVYTHAKPYGPSETEPEANGEQEIEEAA